MHRILFVVFIALVELLAACSGVESTSTVPESISYQGRLSDSTGKLVPDGSYALTFRFYDAATGGSLLWTSDSVTVGTVGGAFTAQIDNIPTSILYASDELWMEVTVRSETLSPRVRVTSVPLAMRSGQLTTQNIQDNSGFETFGGGVPGWTISYGNAAVVSDVKHSGSKSLWCSNNVALRSQSLITVEPGYMYYMSVWGKYSNLVIGSYGVGFGLEQLRSDMSVNGDWYAMMAYVKYGEGTIDWTYAEAQWIPKETTVYLRPMLLVWATSGDAWFDDIRVWKEPIPDLSVAIQKNIVDNGSFEDRH